MNVTDCKKCNKPSRNYQDFGGKDESIVICVDCFNNLSKRYKTIDKTIKAIKGIR